MIALIRLTLLVASTCTIALASPTSIEHAPDGSVFSQPADITQREPEIPREEDTVSLWARVAFQFTYDRVAIYYTTDGSDPVGAFGAPGNGATSVLTSLGGDIQFQFNEVSGGTYDWWKATFPAPTRAYGLIIKYKLSAWDSGGGPEVFANSGNAYQFTNKLAWPGAGAGSPNPNEGYPPVSFWKEEAVVGNNYINVMIDQNGTVYDIHFPGAGAVYGVGTKNEGYANGNDTFPALTSGRGQMHVNQLMAGIREGGTTYWMSNQSGLGYDNVAQAYHPTSNTVSTTARFYANGNDISIQQTDFSPAGITFPTISGGGPNRGVYIKRFVLTNNGGSPKTINFYAYGDYAINGGDGSDAMYQDGGASHGAMFAYDNAGGSANSRGEYNPTFDPDYPKNNSIYFGTALKHCAGVGSAAGTPATDSWRDTSADNGQGWIGMQLTLTPGVPVEIDLAVGGGYVVGANNPNVGNDQVRPVFDWFFSNSMSTVETTTNTYWTDWLTNGVTIDFPDNRYDEVFRRGLLATALHIDGQSKGIIAGFHNGAYPFCWPRDAVYAAVCLARTGHIPESAGVYDWMRDTCYRDNESWGKGYWKQKYTTDGYTVWSSPQIDETAVFPWGLYYHYQITGDTTFVSGHYATMKEAATTIHSDPGNPALLPKLNYNPVRRLMWSNNVWEDQYNFFAYSNANVVRGLYDAAALATALGFPSDASDFNFWGNTIKGGLDDWLNDNNEITDISQLGIVYPFKVYSPTDTQAVRYIDRMNGVQNDTTGNSHPLINFTNTYGWLDLINRYWGDNYWGRSDDPVNTPWGAGPWFLSTLWYGLYYAERADLTANKGDIDNHKYRVDLCLDRVGPVGFGAEQIAPYCGPVCGCPNCGSLQYQNQNDFVLQTAWPNAWESMSTFVDAVMAFLDYAPDAPSNFFRIDPKLPTGWPSMTFNNLYLGGKRFNAVCAEQPGLSSITFTNVTGGTLNFRASLRVPAGSVVYAVTLDCAPITYSYDSAIGRVELTTANPLGSGAGNVNTVRVYYGPRGDFNANSVVDLADVPVMVAILLGLDTDCAKLPIADVNADGTVDGRDLGPFVDAIVP